MENLKAIKDRIATVGNIVKATNAMKMVATVKLARMNSLNKYAKNCCEKLFEMLSLIIGNMAYDQKLDDDSWLLPKKDGRPLILALSTNQGFCGSFTQSILDESKKAIAANKTAIVKIFGTKAAALAPEALVEIEDRFDIGLFAKTLADIVVDHLQSERISKIIVVSGYFKNSLVQKAGTREIFPFHIDPQPKYVKVDGSENETADVLFAAYLLKLFTSIISEHIVSELSARTITMDSSVKNAKDMLRSLNTLYNRSRQAKITQELTEIVASMECVQ